MPQSAPKKMCIRSKVTIPLNRDGSSLLHSPNTLGGLKRTPPGYYLDDARCAMKANRAGTRGFRAPEVLFKHNEQSRAIDLWSVGVIFLCLLTRRYPFFNSPDDQDALIEIAMVIGSASLHRSAAMCGRIWRYNVPAVPDEHAGFRKLVREFNPELFPQLDEHAFDLLEKLLCYDWFERITAANALKHPFIQMLGGDSE